MRFSRNHGRVLQFAGVACLLLFPGWPTPAPAHEIPADVTLRLYVRPEGQTLRVLVRVPLEAMRDVVIPTRDSAFLDLAAAQGPARSAAEVWIAGGLRAYENGQSLGRPGLLTVQLSLPSDRSFDSWEEALAHVQGPSLPLDTDLIGTQAQLDVLLEFVTRSDTSAFAMETDFARLGFRTLSVVRFLPPGGPMRVFEYPGDAGRLQLDPRWHQAASRFVRSGVSHILSGVDHLLFLVCLAVPLRRLRSLALMATAFTVAHSLTLIAATFGFVPSGLWFPPLVETLIAFSIVWMAFENIVGGSETRRRWVLTFGFGLVHGFGFSFALRDTLQFGGTHFVTSLVAFNGGVEIGQIMALLVIVPTLHVLFRFVVQERIGSILVSALVAHHAWHWMMEGGQALWAHDWPFSFRETAFFLLRGAIVVWVVAWSVWWVGRRTRAARNRTLG